MFVLLLFFSEKNAVVFLKHLKTSYEVIYAIYDSIFFIKLFKICTHCKTFTLIRSIKHTYFRETPPPLSLSLTNVSMSYVFDII